MKRAKLGTGDIFEIQIKRGFGYARVLGKDEFGTMFEVSLDCFPSAMTDLELNNFEFLHSVVVYINVWAAKKEWIWRLRSSNRRDELPVSFWGTPKTGWHLSQSDASHKINPKEKSYEQMVNDGFVGRTLWLPKDIKAYLDENKPLIWCVWPQ